MLKWLSENKAGLTFAGTAVALFTGVMLSQGCQIADFVKVDVPTIMEQGLKVDDKVTLSEAPYLLEQWAAAGNQFEDEIEEAYEWLGFIESLSTTTLQVGGSAIPGGAGVLALLTGLSGVFMTKPGTQKKISQEKEDSYNAGVEKGKALAEAAFAAVKTSGA